MKIYIILLIYISYSIGIRLFQSPIKINQQNKIAIIIFPGFGKSSTSYKLISREISNKLLDEKIHCDIYIHNFINNFPLFGNIQAEILTKNTIKKGNYNKNIFFIGHSAGSYFINNIAKKYGIGFIQMGNVLNSNGILPWEKENLNDYPINTLTLLGQKDGYLNPFLAIDEFNSINNSISFKKPIVIEKSINHLQMSDNVKSIYADIFKRKDIISPLSLSEAHNSISDTIVEFIVDTIFQTNHINLYNKIYNTKELLTSYNNSKVNINHFTTSVQQQILDPFSNISIINTNYEKKSEFIYSKPTIINNTIYTSSYQDKKLLSNKYYSNSIWCKMKSKENFLNNSNIILAKNINEQNFNKLLYKLKNNTSIINGPKVIFEEDLQFIDNIMIGISWVNSNINIKHINNTLYIKSPTLISSLNNVPRYAGMYYMKLLSPELCFELIELYF